MQARVGIHLGRGPFGESEEHRRINRTGVVKENASALTDEGCLCRRYGRGIVGGGISNLLAALNQIEGGRAASRSESMDNAEPTEGSGDVGMIVGDVFGGGFVEVELIFLADYVAIRSSLTLW